MLTTTVTRRQVNVGNRAFSYECPWDGKPFRLPPAFPLIAFDTETEMVEDLSKEIPRLALASVSAGRHALLHPDQVGQFILAHRDACFVFHNVAFDFWVVDKHLRDRGEEEARRVWWDACSAGRMRDTMLLDVLVRLAGGKNGTEVVGETVRFRNLEEVAAEYTILRVDKEDPFRKRYGEIIGVPWADVEDGFLDYAIKDAIVTHRAYLALANAAELIMREQGYDPNAADSRPLIRRDAVEKFGLLTELVQVKGAVTLEGVTRNGMRLDAERVQRLEAGYRSSLDDAIAMIRRDYPDLLKKGKTGEKVNAASGLPAFDITQLRQTLAGIAADVNAGGKTVIEVSLTPTGKVSTASKEWAQYADNHPLIGLWARKEALDKQRGFLGHLRGDVVHPRYKLMTRTGRTSCTSPNVQQMPRDGGFRELFVASPGHLLLAIDYSYVELRTLAAVCEAWFGKSQLADTIRRGIDPHCFTAAMLLGTPLDEFMGLRDSDPKRFKDYRQSAKAVNFGVPGGLGAKKLVGQARENYGVSMTEDEATSMRARLIRKVYPELSDEDGYLADDGMRLLAAGLKTTTDKCWRTLDWRGTRDKSVVRSVQKIVDGNAIKADGTPYSAGFVREIWEKLRLLNRNGDPRLEELLDAGTGSQELGRLLFARTVVSPTGRVRTGVAFTAAKNTPFQALAADGAKLALWELTRAGFRIVGFVHDEILIELPDDDGFVRKEVCERVKKIMCDAMEAVTPGIPIDAEYTVSRRWSKEAKLLVEGDRVYAWDDSKKD